MNIELFAGIKCPKCNHLHFAPKSEQIHAVKCAVCDKLHDQKGHDYIAVQGNVTIGMNRGIIGNNIEHDIVTKVSIFCKGKCFESVCTGILSDDTLKCPTGKSIGESFVNCGRKPDCSEKYPKEYQKCLELSE